MSAAWGQLNCAVELGPKEIFTAVENLLARCTASRPVLKEVHGQFSRAACVVTASNA